MINSILGLFNLKIIKKSQLNSINNLCYISAYETVKNAKSEDLSVCDYVEKMWNQVGETQKIINSMEKYGTFEYNNPTICEIGAGTGRYMEKVIDKCNPAKYESYETAKDWSDWLQNTYPIISHPTNGFSLKSTIDNSIDIVHAHGVFVYLKFLDNIRYFNEIIRIIKPNGVIIFDCYTEECMTTELLNNWLQSKHNFPVVLPNDYVISYFEKFNFKLLGNFFNAHGQGKSKYFVFKRTDLD
jgi:SAM-dependent methyltransferase